MNYKKHLKIAKQAILAPQNLIIDNFSKTLTVISKEGHDVRLAIDKKAEQKMIEEIEKKFPTHGFNTEESGERNIDNSFVWYIDPLDGTNNYFSGIPYFASSIALSHEGSIVLSVIYNTILEKMYCAVRNQGAEINENKIQNKNEVQNLTKATICFIRGHRTFSVQTLLEEGNNLEEKLEGQFRRVIKMWAPVVDWGLLAEGKINAVICFEDELQELYAGTLLAKEAGLEVVDFTGQQITNSTRRVIASNKYLKPGLVKLVKKIMGV
ncbi:hypothetical protein GF362_06680 [Candidatus Dojkabacteria bacterium]|nr:hypothetical protein [Candidatus Dojkabacteria bacterium]